MLTAGNHDGVWSDGIGANAIVAVLDHLPMVRGLKNGGWYAGSSVHWCENARLP